MNIFVDPVSKLPINGEISQFLFFFVLLKPFCLFEIRDYFCNPIIETSKNIDIKKNYDLYAKSS